MIIGFISESYRALHRGLNEPTSRGRVSLMRTMGHSRSMDPNWRHPYGLRPTIRHLMILVLDVALLSALARLLGGGIHGNLFILLALSPPLLSVLILVFERPSPAKYWLAGLIISPFLAFLAVRSTSWRRAPGGTFRRVAASCFSCCS